jgi:hypothetical protein
MCRRWVEGLGEGKEEISGNTRGIFKGLKE